MGSREENYAVFMSTLITKLLKKVVLYLKKINK